MIDNSQASPMDRHSEIISILMQRGSTSVSVLSELLKVSEVTIRKDLTILEQQNRLYRTHGKAILISPYIADRPVREKEKQNVNEKMAIATKACESVVENDSIIVASGTTMLFFAHQLQQNAKQTTIITSSIQVSAALSLNRNIEIFQLGGFVRNSSLSVIGDYAEEILKSFHCSKLFLGVDGIDPEFGITTTNVMEATLNRVMLESTQRVIVLSDSSKFGRRGFSKICEMDQVDEIITDQNIHSLMKEQLEEKGVVVTIVNSL